MSTSERVLGAVVFVGGPAGCRMRMDTVNMGGPNDSTRVRGQKRSHGMEAKQK
jgi:hypothetical protein